MTHKIYWAERGLRYLYEVVTAELFMYTFSMIFMRQDPRFVDAIWQYCIYKEKKIKTENERCRLCEDI